MGWKVQEAQSCSSKSFPRAASFPSAALSLLLPRSLLPLVPESTLGPSTSAVTEEQFSSEEQFQPKSPPAQDSPCLPWWQLSAGSGGCICSEVGQQVWGEGAWKM